MVIYFKNLQDICLIQGNQVFEHCFYCYLMFQWPCNLPKRIQHSLQEDCLTISGVCLAWNIIFAVQMHRINNIDVKVIISEVCCAYILREYAHILAFLLKGMLLVIYHLWPLPDVWEQFSKSLPKIIVNNLQYFSAHVLSAPYFLLFFFFWHHNLCFGFRTTTEKLCCIHI